MADLRPGDTAQVKREEKKIDAELADRRQAVVKIEERVLAQEEEIDKKLTISGCLVSAGAKTAIEKAGGTVHEFNPDASPEQKAASASKVQLPQYTY